MTTYQVGYKEKGRSFTVYLEARGPAAAEIEVESLRPEAIVTHCRKAPHQD